LFAGCGTFALPLARKAKVHAVEQDSAALAALAAAARAPGLKPLTTEIRDLFKLPLAPVELNAYDAVVLDPPRAGAEAQAKALAKSRVPAIAYISCDAASFARDAALLTGGGYRMGPVTPIDQFLWSSHIELAGSFRRP
jgi:23S rRNA (uracil1939-C5)-methyltransferase